MTENLRIVLLIVGVIAIAALLIHGIWSSRKERSSFFSERSLSRQKKRGASHNRENLDEIQNFDSDHLNIDDVGEVKVVSRGIKQTDDTLGTFVDHTVFQNENQFDVTESNDKQLNIDFESKVSKVSETVSSEPKSPEQNKYNEDAEPNSPTDLEIQNIEPVKQTNEHVIIFHVVGLNMSYLRGDLLLNSFLNAGLHYGDMNIFHKHIGAANTPILFSIANMVNPGTFEPARMSEFSTPGITCFMVLPTAGQPIQNFKIMLQTIQRIADDVGGIVWDNERRLITPQKIEEYRIEIREWLQQNQG